MGPDFHGGQKITNKFFPLKWQKRTKKIQTLLGHTKKYKKRVQKYIVTKKYFDLSGKKDKKRNCKRGS